MIDVEYMINKPVFEKWFDIVKETGVTQESLAKEFDVDAGDFSKMINGKMSPPKHVMEKLVGRSFLPHIVVPMIDSNGIKVPMNGGK